MQKRDRADQSEILHVIAASACAVAQEGQLLRKGIDDMKRFKQTLRVAMHRG